MPLSQETLEAARRREPDALAELFERCFDRVYTLSYRLTGEHEAAEDVAQDVFLKVYKAAHQIDPSRAVEPWLTAITHNACREHWRSRGHRLFSRSLSLNGAAGKKATPLNGRKDPERATESAEREKLVMKALKKLPEPMRVVVVLHDYQGISHDEIARLTKTRHTAVRKRYSRALARLRDELKDVLR
jgi:RNA polymerase sigma-70 factor (ECF subfamily)